jgi:hypothetical protein
MGISSLKSEVESLCEDLKAVRDDIIRALTIRFFLAAAALAAWMIALEVAL